MRARFGSESGLASFEAILSSQQVASLSEDSGSTETFDARAANPASLQIEAGGSYVSLKPAGSVLVLESGASDEFICTAKEFDRGVASGSSGGSGTGSVSAQGVTTDTISDAGFPLATNRLTGGICLARADIYHKSFVLGVSKEAVDIGFVAEALREVVTINDWTQATGSPTLTPGDLYYLASEGGLTKVRPTSPGDSVVVIGTAANETTLIVNPSNPILL